MSLEIDAHKNCDVYEVANELLDALRVAVDTLNQIPNTRLSYWRNSYAVASQLNAVLQKYKEGVY